MFSWFRPNCPLELKHKVWIEHGLRTLASRLGLRQADRQDMVVPTSDAIPELAPGKAPDIESLTQRLCDRLSIDRNGLTIRVVSKLPVDDAIGVYRADRREILLQDFLLSDPSRLLATLLHELLHDLLLRGGTLSGMEPDHEQLTDLSACLLGCSIPMANATVRISNGHSGAVSGWETSRIGYLSSPELGYAMAACCWLDGMTGPPPWSKYLRLDAREPLRKGLKYLTRTGDSLFRIGSGNRIHLPTVGELTQSLTTGTNTEILGALWDLPEFGGTIDPVRACQLVSHDESVIRVTSCEELSMQICGKVARDPLFDAADSADPLTRASAIQAFARNCPNDPELALLLKRAINDSNYHVACSAFTAMSQVDMWDTSLESIALNVLSSLMIRFQMLDINQVMSVLHQKVTGLEQKLRDQLSDPRHSDDLNEAIKALRRIEAKSRGPFRA